MTPTDAIVTAILGAEGCITFLYARSQDRRAARDGFLYRASDLGRPQEPRPAESATESAQDAPEAPVTRALPLKLPGLTTGQVHEITGWSESTVKRLENAGILTARRNHLGHRRFDEAEVRAAMNGSAAS